MISNIVVLLIIVSASIWAFPQRDFTDLPQYTKLNSNQVHYLQREGFGPTVPSVFAVESTNNDAEDTETAATQEKGAYLNYPNYPNVIPLNKPSRVNLDDQPQLIVQRPQAKTSYVQQRPYPQQFQRPEHRVDQRLEPRPQQKLQSREPTKEEEDEAEIEEPDRLSILLPQSTFTCVGKNTGYYADEGLGCEVFHYCQDNAKHSWICPDGFTFHQIHLICMPPSNKEGICNTSSQYHFVNEYLYKPINLDEYQHKPNTSLRYSERYYPGNVKDDEEQEHVVRPKHSQRVQNHQLIPQQQHHHHQHQQQYQQQQQQQYQQQQQQKQYQQQIPIPKNLLVSDQISRTTFRPETNVGQVFRSPNDVNIPLQQRRPVYAQQRYVREGENDY